MDVRFLCLIVFVCTLSSPLPVLALQRDASTLTTTAVEFASQKSSHAPHSLEKSSQEGPLTVHRSERVPMQSSTTGVSMRAKLLLSLGNRKVLAMKAEDDKVQPKSKGHEHDTTSTNLGKGLSADTTRADGTDHENSTDKVKSGNKETGAPPPPPAKPEDEQSAPGKEGKVNNTTPKVEKPDDQVKNNTKPPDIKPNAPANYCGESHCEDPKKSVSACLRIPGDGVHKLALLITNEGDSEVLVKVVAPEYLAADRLEVSVLKGKSETIQFLINSKYELSTLDMEAVKNKSITVITSSGKCEIAVPLEHLRNSVLERKPSFPSYLPSITPRVVAYVVVLVLVVAIVGVWMCYKCCRKKRGGEVKYQQLEMIVPGQSSPKERAEPNTGGWDEVWDDDWEDTEAAKSSSRLSQNLSSRGLGARRGNKDGWDNSWED